MKPHEKKEKKWIIYAIRMPIHINILQMYVVMQDIKILSKEKNFLI